MKRILTVVMLSFMAQLFSQLGNGLAFDGADDIVDISSSITTVTTNQDITVEAWIYPKSNAKANVIVSKYYGGSSSGSNFMVARGTDQKILIAGNGSNAFISNGIIPLNTWTHIAVVFKAGTNNTKIYISGVLDISGTLNYNTVNSTTNMRIGEFTNIGSYTAYSRLSGTIDELRLWNTARTAEQISGNMSSPLTGSETGLVALYSFDQGVAGGSNPGVTTLSDLTGHNYSGTLLNFALTGTTSNWVAGYIAPVLPEAPVAIPATNISYTSFTANWNVVSGATNYYLDVDDNNDFSSPFTGYNNLSVGNVLLKAVTGLTLGTTYYYRLRAYNPGGTGGNSNTIALATLYIEIPGEPVAVAATSLTSSSFTANWSASSGADGYYLDVDDNNDFSSPLTGYNSLGVGNVLLKAVTGLTPNTNYYYRLRAFNLGGTSGNSNTVSVVTATPAIPDAPVAVAATSLTYSSFTANWKTSTGADGYYLDVDDNNDFSSPLTGYDNLSVGNVLLKAVTGLSPSTNYYYRLRAYNIGGISGSSNTISELTLFTQFYDVSASLTGVYNSSTDWGDYDNDGDLDILHTGYTGSDRISKIYRNDSSTFTDINAGLFGVSDSSVDWGDYDNDGDLDILLTGYSSISPYYISKIYRNDSGMFTDIKAGLSGVSYGSVAWGDYDNDGDLDILLTGEAGLSKISKIYRNDSGIFTDINAGLTGVEEGSVAWGDYDNDGDLDILLTGDSGTIYISKIYRNDSGSFTDISAGLTGVWLSSVAWGDYDNDGDLDILLTGDSGTIYISKIYRNDSGIFTDINAGLTGVRFGSVAWGDYDNDGDLDILMTGYSISIGRISKLYRNDSGIFTDRSTSLIGVYSGSAAWGDYDNDNDLDILLTGYSGSLIISKIYRNNSPVSNTKPNVPSNLISQMGALSTVLSWDKATDAQTPQNGLIYNLYIGTSSQTGNKKSPMSNIQTGYRKIVSLGNSNQKNSYAIKNLPEGQYYWSVQAVDHAFAGSEFSTEQSFILNIDPPPVTVATEATNADVYSFTANWEITSDTKGYYLDVATDSSFTNYVSGYQNRDVANVTSSNVTGLLSFTNYYYRVRAYNNGGTGVNSNTISFITLYTQFLQIATNLTGVEKGSVAWGDYDNDGDLDILLTGRLLISPFYISKIYRNDSGIFTDINAGPTGVEEGSVAWGDYDNDGDLDILLTGFSSFSPNYISKIYRNDSGVFADINAGLTGVDHSSAAWGDYDNDGDLDILLTGYSGSVRLSKIYRNDAGVFSDANAGLIGVSYGSVAWGDYDNDGDLDLLLMGYTGSSDISRIYRNDSGIFTDINAGLVGAQISSAAWGDYDNDGDLDILLTGYTGSSYISKIYRNDSGVFADINAGLTGVWWSSSAWGDYDCDGDLDILCTGNTGSTNISKIYRNDSGIFTDINAGLTGVYYSSVAWGDYDNDGDLDILITGNTGSKNISKIYNNISLISNTKPNAPNNLSTVVTDNDATLSWDKATDAQTPQNGLSYNLYIGTVSQTGNKKSPMSNIPTGYRKVVNLGNANQKNSYTIKNLPVGTYYWSVQAVDNAFSGSNFAVEKTFFQGAAIPTNVNVIVNGSNVTISWGAVAGATSYKILACDDPYGEFAEISSEGVFDDTSWSYTNLAGKKFYYVTAVWE